jgi:hypothetical protein
MDLSKLDEVIEIKRRIGDLKLAIDIALSGANAHFASIEHCGIDATVIHIDEEYNDAIAIILNKKIEDLQLLIKAKLKMLLNEE